AGFTLFVFGSGFVSGAGATVQFNGTSLPATVLSSSELEASVPASLLTSAATVPVTVTQINGQRFVTSNSVTFTLGPVSNSGAPTVSSLIPTRRSSDLAGFTLFVFGSGFVSGAGATVQFSGTSLPATVLSSSELEASVPASLLSSAATVP